MKSILAKKGQLSSLPNSVIILIIAAIFLVLGVVVLAGIQETDIVAKTFSTSIINESATMTGVAVSLNGASACQATCTLGAVVNGSSSITLSAANYTFVGADCTIVNLTSTFAATNWNVTYSYTSGDIACNSANQTVGGLASFADFWEIIILAVVITIVIGLLLVVFGGRRVR